MNTKALVPATMGSLFLRAGVLAMFLVAAAAVDARADIFAVLCVPAPAPRTDMDIALVNATVGTRQTLPVGVNTTAEEVHPSISTDGRRLAFERFDRTLGTTHIIVVDQSTGVSTDVFTAFELAAHPEFGPALTPDGMTVVTGGASDDVKPQLTLTDLQLLPYGPPFPHQVVTLPKVGSTTFGQNAFAVAAGGAHLFAFQVNASMALSQITEAGSVTCAKALVGGLSGTFSSPAIAANNPQVVLFESNRNIMFRPASCSGFVGVPISLSPIVNSFDDESQPAITADERYVAFVRHSRTDFHDRLFVFDTVTQTLLNAAGVDLGLVDTDSRSGSLSLFTKRILLSTSISQTGHVTGTLTLQSNVGILVQRVVGTTTVLGKRAYALEPVGRVPLGEFDEGTFHTLWDLTVNDQPLEPGEYLVTVRAVEGGVARELGHPRLFVVPDHHHRR
jgi:hypothetical protein